MRDTSPGAGDDNRRRCPVRDACERPDLREKLARGGPAQLDDCELIALLLGPGTRGRDVSALAREPLDASGGLAGLLQPYGPRVNSTAMAAGDDTGPRKRCSAAIRMAPARDRVVPLHETRTGP